MGWCVVIEKTTPQSISVPVGLPSPLGRRQGWYHQYSIHSVTAGAVGLMSEK